MTESIYNNAGMPSEQKAAPEIPQDVREQYRICVEFLAHPGEPSDKPIEWCVQFIERIAALTLVRDTLKAERDEPWKHSEHWRNPETGQVECDCCCGWALDAEQTAKEVAALKAKVERLSAPVSGDVATLLCNLAQILDVVKIEWAESWSEWDQQQRDAITAFLTAYYARASTPPAHPINDNEQRRKDAAWNDRPKARCACGEMIAWYSGEYLHVAGRSKSCADGRLASPAHFLVGRTSADIIKEGVNE